MILSGVSSSSVLGPTSFRTRIIVNDLLFKSDSRYTLFVDDTELNITSNNDHDLRNLPEHSLNQANCWFQKMVLFKCEQKLSNIVFFIHSKPLI